MSLSYYKSPGMVYFLDDDPDYLDMMALVLPRQWCVRLFLHPRDMLDALAGEHAHWDTDAAAQQAIVTRWRRDQTALVPQILDHWSLGPQRYGHPQVLLLDYNMPAMNGLQVLQVLGDWPGMRVLLTGQADEQLAVRAFNEGWIHQFLPKQTPDIAQHIAETVNRLQTQAGGRQSQIWRATLTPHQQALLRAPGVGAALARRLGERWVEHVVIGEPFGVLGRTAGGAVQWLQLEPAGGLEELAEMAEAAVSSFGALAEIRQGRQLVDLDLRNSLGESVQAPRLATAFPIGQDEALLGAFFDLDDRRLAPATSYDAWLSSQPERAVEG